MKKILLFLGLSAGLFGLGFGGMGNTSAGLGNSGVALRKSAWGIYYNPALLASDNRGKFGYSVGLDLNEKGIFDLLSKTDISRLSFNGGLNLSSQNGLVIQITGGSKMVPESDQNMTDTENDLASKMIGRHVTSEDMNDGSSKMIEKRNPYGAFTIAAFLSGYIQVQASAEITNNQGRGSGSLQGVALMEVPVGWGWRFETIAGDISVGAAIKYMGVMGIDRKQFNVSVTNNGGDAQFDYTLPNLAFSPDISHFFGIDLGLLYSPLDSLHLGLVAKNINAPSFKVGGEDFRILPQVRFGISYEFARFFALTYDMDLMPNESLGKGSPKTATMGGGLLMDFKYIDLRVGLMGDMGNKFQDGVIMTGGLNLLGFLDVAVQASSKMHTISGWKVPSYVNLKVGGSFTF